MVLPAVILAAASFLGFLLVPLLSRRPVLHTASTAFAAGTLLTVILMHVLPEAMGLVAAAPTLFVLGFVGMMLLQQHVLKADPCCGHEHAAHAGWPSYAAMALCSFNDGVVMHHEHDFGLGSPLLWGMAVHKITASFALIMLLNALGEGRGGLGGPTSMVVFSAITPVTMLLAHQLELIQPYMGYVLAISGGALLYVIVGSMVPRVEHVARAGRWPVIGAFLFAVLLSVAFDTLGGHEH